MKGISFEMKKNYEQNRKFCVVEVDTLVVRALLIAGILKV